LLLSSLRTKVPFTGLCGSVGWTRELCQTGHFVALGSAMGLAARNDAGKARDASQHIVAKHSKNEFDNNSNSGLCEFDCIQFAFVKHFLKQPHP
jgi:hypothetical protein